MDRPLNLVHIVEDISPISGGVATVVKMLTSEIQGFGIKQQVVCNYASNVDFAEDIKITTFAPSKYDLGWGYNNDLISFLKSESCKENTVFHIHGVWKAIHFFSARLAIKNNIPTLMTLHGMMDPFLWNNQGNLKRIKKDMYWSVMKTLFCEIRNIHAITDHESKHLSTRFRKSKISLIPNSMRIDANKLQHKDIDVNKKYFLFIGRIAKQKGLDILIKSFLSIDPKKNMKLKIIGPIEDQNYWGSLERLIESDSIEYLGPKFGKEKKRIIENAWACVVPSRMEAIGMVNLESANEFCPSITTFQTGLNDWEKGGGLLINADSIKSCKEAILKANMWTLKERISRGLESFKLVNKKYNIAVTNKSWIELYKSL